ncbi:putative dna repair protein rad57 protein [Rhypophila sp. PSN 637]
MTDLIRVLPHFPVGQYANLIPVLERHGLTTSDLLTLDAADIGKRTHLPLLDVKRFCSAVLAALHADLGVSPPPPSPRTHSSGADPVPRSGSGAGADRVQTNNRNGPFTNALRNTPASLGSQWQTISTLDESLDRALSGGIPAGYITEITGESGAGKTQFLLTLLLAVQLPPPHGLGRPALYISTEASLSTRRLSQMLNANPLFRSMDRASRPSLDQIMSTATPDLESQDHILTFQVPVEVERRNIGLIILDSVAANYRAEFERSASRGQSSNMGARSADLVRLGMHLRELAQKYNLAVVVSNQVADRFGSGGIIGGSFKTPASSASSRPHPSLSNLATGRGSLGNRATQEIPLATRSKPLPPTTDIPSSSLGPGAAPGGISSTPAPAVPLTAEEEERFLASSMRPPPPPPFPGDEDSIRPQPPALLLDHQQQWFTGWGDDRYADYGLKTPSLGLVWSTQISARIALLKRPSYGPKKYGTSGKDKDGADDDDDEYADRSARGMPTLRNWRRWMKMVFSPHAPASGPGTEDTVEFEIYMGGIRAITGKNDEKETKGGET